MTPKEAYRLAYMWVRAFHSGRVTGNEMGDITELFYKHRLGRYMGAAHVTFSPPEGESPDKQAR